MNPRLSEERALELAKSSTEPAENAVVWSFDPLHRTPAPRPYKAAEWYPVWRGIRAPVLALYGSETWMVLDDLDDRHKAVPKLIAGVIQGAGHNLHHDQPSAVAATVRAWLQDSGKLPDGLTRI
jgi:pimeloyl-ACP methyl ester carboxylesterase